MDTDTSLNHNQFLKNKKEVCEVLQSIKSLSSAKRKMEALSKKFNYIRLFSKQGVQGLTGELEIKKNKLPVVFKVSVELDKSVEHENSVLEALSSIKSFCPNFIGVYNMLELPVSRTYILDNKDDEDYYSTDVSEEESEEESSSESEEESKNSESDKVEEYMAQKHLSFTHYDLHIDNIMLKPIDENAMFVYNLGTDAFLIPTFGVYPIIIDMGSSYCKHLEDQSMKSSPNHYDKGLQPTFYDTFNDIHHFLLSLFNEIERESEEYYFLSTRLMWLFRSIPLLRKKGWKMLPIDVLKTTRNHIRDLCPELYKLSSYHDFDKDFLEVLSFGIKLPWKNDLDKDIIKSHELEKSENTIIDFAIKKYLLNFFNEFQKFDEIEGFEDPHDLLFILKEIVDLVYLHSDNLSENTHKAIIKRMINDFKTRVGFCLYDIPESINFGNLFYSCKMSISILKCMFYDKVKPNIEKINDCYSKMEVKSAIDIIKFIKKNTSVRYNYNRHTSLYIWDGVNKTSKKIMLNSLITNNEVEKLNKDHPTLSEYKILKLLKLKK
jgi:hypothetical protein